MSESDESIQTAEEGSGAVARPETAEPEDASPEVTDPDTAARDEPTPEPVEPEDASPEVTEPAPVLEAVEPAPAPGFDLPPVVAAAQAPDAVLAEAAGGGLTWIPYAVYLGAWLLLSGATAFLLKDATAADLLGWRALPASGPIVWTGVGLTAAGPILSLAVWLVARRRRPAGARRGLLVSALIRGALTAVFGVVIWVVTLQVLELVSRGAFS